MRDARLDHLFVEAREVDDSNPTRLFQYLGGDMVLAVGNPAVDYGESAGWGLYRGDLTAYAGRTVELRFHLDSGMGNHATLAGFAVDDVAVVARVSTMPFIDGFASGNTSAWSMTVSGP